MGGMTNPVWLKDLGSLPGDYVHILARQRHRVEWTADGQQTVWLALHYLFPSKTKPLKRWTQKMKRYNIHLHCAGQTARNSQSHMQ
jgi:hypothetical protein